MKKNNHRSKTVYPLEWLDDTVALLSDAPQSEGTEYPAGLAERLDSDIGQLKKQLNGIAFSTLKRKKIKRLFLHYHATLSLLQRQTRGYRPPPDEYLVLIDESIAELLEFMELRFGVYLNEQDSPIKKGTERRRSKSFKLVCALSEDQLGIIFRSADDLRIIMSRSLSNIFNQIVPYLSTLYKEELSPDGMRSHTYSIEERDKQVVIETLQKMIEKIKEY